MTSSVRISFGFAALATLIQAGILNAQEPGKAAGGLQIAQVSGTMQALALDKIKIVAEDKKEFFAVVSQQTSLNYKGTAEPGFLSPGLLVRFNAELTQTGQAQGTVTELEVFTISQNRRMSQEQMRDQTAGVYQVGGEAGNAKKPDDKPKGKSSKPNAASSKAAAQPYRVVGQVAGMKAGKVMVQAGAVQVQFELDPKAVITVSSHDTTFCQVGDQVKVSGLRNAGQEQFIQAESLEIVGTKPLAPVDVKSAKNSKSAKGSKSKNAKDGKDKDDAGDDSQADSKKPDTKKTTSKK
jgi:hypothetical protein